MDLNQLNQNRNHKWKTYMYQNGFEILIKGDISYRSSVTLVTVLVHTPSNAAIYFTTWEEQQLRTQLHISLSGALLLYSPF